MKKSRVWLVWSMTFILLSGCRDTGAYSKKPDDSISRMIMETIGDDYSFRYHEENDDKTFYNFEIITMEPSTVSDFVDACNNALPEKKEKISFIVSFHIMGGFATMFVVRNYDDVGEIYDSISYLYILDQMDFNEAFCDPTLYSEIEGIKVLHVDKAIQDKADAMRVDWFSYWPELEKIVVEGD
ncbi:MAG: hypothetical protein K6E50_10930 [Lachnospiraceae bacterium]|nr:hypothetical protein [Lachnospiraceae bacterium]